MHQYLITVPKSAYQDTFKKWMHGLKLCISSLGEYFKGMMDGWMTCDFTSFSTVFQSYQDDERLIMKGFVQWSQGDEMCTFGLT